MTPLGRGLASLIPKINKDKAKEMLARIDSMEFVEEALPVTEETENEEVASAPQRKVSVVEEFEDVTVEEELPMPSKPLVTPLTFDEEQAEIVAQVSDEPEDEEGSEEEEEVPAPEVKEEVEEVQETEETPAEEVFPEDEPEEVVEKQEPAAVAEEVVEEVAQPVAQAAPAAEATEDIWDKHEDQVQHIPIGEIHINPLQPRRIFDPQEMEELTRSIEQHGILQPLVVHRKDNGYELIAGERRLRAAKGLGWDKVPAVVRRDVNTNQSRLVFALIENIQRENLNPIEEAMAYHQLNTEFGLTHEEIGQRVGRSRVGITNIVRVLQLPDIIQQGLSEGKISMGHARAILMIPDPEKQVRFYQHLLDEGLTVRKAETRARRVQRSMNLNDPQRKKTHGRHMLAIKYAPRLEEKFGHDAYIKFVAEKNRFEIAFRAYSEEDVHELVGQLLAIRKDNSDLDSDIMDDQDVDEEE
jgi:ParB family chromosome partitioning protein